jgi:DNA-binding transcriptional LysR family regulator
VEVRSLDYFLAVVEQGSLRAAAQSIGLTQPALTKAIRRLEDSFGVRLFDRKARGVILTGYGQVVLSHARELQTSFKAVKDEVEALRHGISGLVRIGAGPSWQDAILPDAIRRLRAERPGVRVRVIGGTDDQLKKLLKSGELDLVLAAVPEAQPLEPMLAWRPLLADEYCVIADQAHPLRIRPDLSPDMLITYPWVLPSSGTYMVDRLRLMLRGHGLPLPEPAIETDVISFKFAVMRGSDYLSFHAIAHVAEVAPGFIQPLAVPGMTAVRDAGIILLRDAEPSPAARYCIEILTSICAAVSAKPRLASVTGSGPAGEGARGAD